MNLEIEGSKITIADDLALLDKFLSNFSIKDKIYIITDKNVYNLYNDKIRKAINLEVNFIVLEAGEKTKNIDSILEIVTKLLELGIRRNDYIIGLGGGVICDMTGFAASILYRGIPHILIPTTLLADVDASVGGKTGVDFLDRKNILGSFYTPKGIYISTSFLNTLPKEEIASGYGEIFKYAFLENTSILQLLKDKADLKIIILKCLQIKQSYVESDFKDQGKRMMLNLGHTFGHLVELDKNLLHGIAVLAGLKMIFCLEKDLGIIDNSFLLDLEKLAKTYDVPLYTFDYKDYLDKIFTDKKNLQGVLHLIFVNEGGAYIYKTTREDLYAKIKNE